MVQMCEWVYKCDVSVELSHLETVERAQQVPVLVLLQHANEESKCIAVYGPARRWDKGVCIQCLAKLTETVVAVILLAGVVGGLASAPVFSS